MAESIAFTHILRNSGPSWVAWKELLPEVQFSRYVWLDERLTYAYRFKRNLYPKQYQPFA